jgi:hypothetical protein
VLNMLLSVQKINRFKYRVLKKMNLTQLFYGRGFTY